MLRILHILGTMGCGGQETFIMNIYRNIDRNKIQFDFLVHGEKKGHYENEIESLGGKVYHIIPKRENLLKNFFQIKNTVALNNYKIIHRHTSNASIVFDLIAAKLGGAKCLIVHAHSIFSRQIFIHRIFRNACNYFSDQRFACSKEAGIWLFDKKSFSVIKNGVNLEEFVFKSQKRKEYRKRYNVENKFVVGHVGRYDSAKNHLFLLEIFQAISKKKMNSQLILIGWGELEDEIKLKIDLLGLKNKVTLLGKRNDISEILSMMDVFLFPSLYEGLGIALIEAQACGLKCFTSKDVVPIEVKVTDLVSFISLREPAESWADKILLNCIYKREDKKEIIQEAGYNIKNSAEYLEKYYTDESLRILHKVIN